MADAHGLTRDRLAYRLSTPEIALLAGFAAMGVLGMDDVSD